MDDSLVAQEAKPPENNVGPVPVPPSQPAPQAKPVQDAPQPKPPQGSFQKSRAFVAIPIVLIIVVIAVGAFMILNKQGPATFTTNSTLPTTTLGSAPASVPSTTIISAGGGSAPSCPCLSEQQLGHLLNLSAAESQKAVFNLSFAQNNTAVKDLLSNNSTANSSASLPEGILNNVTEGWVASYNALNSSATELVLKTPNISQFIAYSASQMNSSTYNVPTGTVNGFNYTYIDLPIFGINAIAIEGHKGNYIIGFGLFSPANRTIASENTIVGELSGAVT